MSDALEAASQEVEATLRKERERVEWVVVRLRVVIASAFVVTGVVNALVASDPVVARDSWFGTVYSLVYVALSLALAVAVRYGVQCSIVGVLATAADLLVVAAYFPLMGALLGWDHADEQWLYMLYPSLLTAALLATFGRYRAAMSIAAAAAAVGLYLGVSIALAGYKPQMLPISAVLALVGGVGAVVALRVHRALHQMARLKLLGRYVPSAALERIAAEDVDAALGPGGRLVEVTLLASDLRGYTAMSEALRPDEVVRQLNEYHAAMLEVIRRHGGELDKFIGDGALVVFGLGQSGGDAGASVAVACAREMLVALEQLNLHRAQRGLAPLQMGIAVHTGTVVAGNIGAGRRVEFTVIGDAVNTVSRLEGQTKELSTPLLVSAATVARLASRDGLTERPPLRLRGRTEPLPVFALAG